MGEKYTLSIVDFGDDFTWEHVQKRLDKEFGYRLPNALEAVYIEFPYQAIWVNDIIGESNPVMDNEWGVQVVHSGAYGLILVEA